MSRATKASGYPPVAVGPDSQEPTMTARFHVPLLLCVVLAVAVFAGCSGGGARPEDHAESRATADAGGGPAARVATLAPADSRGTLDVDCGKDLTAYRFQGRFSLQGAQASPSQADITAVLGSMLQNMTFRGAFVAPNRSQLTLEGGQSSPFGAIEMVQIGARSYMRVGTSAWQESTVGGAEGLIDNLDPRAICTQLDQRLSADVPSRRETVNGVAAVRYDYDRATLEQLGTGLLSPVSGPDNRLPDSVTLNVWVSEREKFPVKLRVVAAGQEDGRPYTSEMEFNVTDLNGNVTIDMPR
jgi:hypothetical protein